MKKHRDILVATALLLLSASTSASMAIPVKITPDGEVSTTGKEEFRNYTLQCSNGSILTLTFWHKGTKWCIGRQSQENCLRQQIKTAKSACRNA